MDATKAAKYLPIALTVASLSKDPSTQAGCCILGEGSEVLSVGYNGAPRGSTADEDLRFADRRTKYLWASHAELNAITNAARIGVCLKGSSLVTTHFPCSECAKAIIQAGITTVFAKQWDEDFYSRWKDSIAVSMSMFDECGVKVVML